MLVLTRKIGEAIQIGDGVSVEVIEVRGGRVRLGISAPNDVKITRTELLISAADLPSLFKSGCEFGPSTRRCKVPV